MPSLPRAPGCRAEVLVVYTALKAIPLSEGFKDSLNRNGHMTTDLEIARAAKMEPIELPRMPKCS